MDESSRRSSQMVGDLRGLCPAVDSYRVMTTMTIAKSYKVGSLIYLLVRLLTDSK